MRSTPWILFTIVALALGSCSAGGAAKQVSKTALAAAKQIEKAKGKKKPGKKKLGKKKPKQGGATVVKKKPAPAGAKVRTATLRADKGLVFGPGKVLVDGSGMKVDLVAYKHGNGLDLKAGRQGTSYLPLHRFGLKTFGKLKDVPCTAPSDSDKNGMLSLPKKGQAFTVRANQSDGVWRVRVKNVSGGEVKLQYQECK